MLKVILLGLLYSAFRLPNLLALPPYTDESLFARWAQLIALGQAGPLVPIFGDGKDPLFIWTGSFFLLFFNDPVFSLRLGAVAGGLATLFGLMMLAQKWLGDRFPGAPVWAALLYIFSPFALFHDRLGIYESWINAVGIFVFLASLRLIEKPQVAPAFGLGLLFFSGLALKNYCVFFMAVPFFLLFEKALFERRRPSIRPMLLSLLAAVVGKSLHVLMHRISAMIYGEDRGLSLSLYLSSPAEEAAGAVLRNASRAFEAYDAYIGLPLLALFGIFLITSVKGKEQGSIALSLYVLGAAGLEIVLAYFIFARYLYFTVPLMLLGCLWGLYRVIEELKKRLEPRSGSPALAQAAFGLALALCLLVPVKASIAILRDPVTAPLDPMDRWQHVTGWPSGYGLDQVIAYLENQARTGPIDVFCKWDKGTGNPYEGMKLALHDHPNIRFHLAFWTEEKPLLFFADPPITINNPVSQSLTTREDLKAEHLGDVYFVGNDPRMDIARFRELNQPFEEEQIFSKPGNQSAYVVFKFLKL